jgi:hypothetical protein
VLAILPASVCLDAAGDRFWAVVADGARELRKLCESCMVYKPMSTSPALPCQNCLLLVFCIEIQAAAADVLAAGTQRP